MDFLNQQHLTGSNLQDPFISLSLTAIVTFLVFLLYLYHCGFNYEYTFIATLVLLAHIVSMLMCDIHSDQVLSLCLIGLLSIVRLCTPIKDKRNMIFLFWVIFIGLGSVTSVWGVMIVASLFIMMITSALYFIRNDHSRNTNFEFKLVVKDTYKTHSAHDSIRRFAINTCLPSHAVQDEHRKLVHELRWKELSHQNADLLSSDMKDMLVMAEPRCSLPSLLCCINLDKNQHAICINYYKINEANAV